MKRLYFASIHKCNQACIFCVRLGKNEPIEYINTADSIEILTRKRNEDFGSLLFDGGEPLLRDDLGVLVRHSLKVGYKEISILTNGTLLEQKLSGILAEIDKDELGKISFSVSLHAHRADIADKITKMKGGFEKTTAGIEKLLDFGVKNVSIFIVINCYNFNLLPEFVEYVSQKFPKIKAITFSFIYPAGEAEHNYEIYPKLSSTESFLLEALKRCEQKKIKFSLTTCGTVPLCFLEKYREVLIKQQELDQPDKVGIVDSKNESGFQLATKEYHAKSKVKASRCKSCKFDNLCGGVWSFYAEKYGTKELKPIKRKREVKKKKEENLLLLTGYSCNNNCIFCSNQGKREKNYTTEQIEKELVAGYKKGFRSVEFIGGEPSIRGDIFSLISRAKLLGFGSIKLTTNGRIFCYPKIARKFKESGLTDLAISIHGSNDRIHKALARTPDSFEQSLEGLRNCLSLEFDSVSVNTVITKLNVEDLGAMALLFQELGLMEWHLLELLPDGKGEKVFGRLAIDPFVFAKKLESVKVFKGTLILFDFPCCTINKELLNSNDVIYVGVLEKGLFLRQKACDKNDDSFRIQERKNNSMEDGIAFEDKYKIKLEGCDDCNYYGICGGISKDYFKIYNRNRFNTLIKKFTKRGKERSIG